MQILIIAGKFQEISFGNDKETACSIFHLCLIIGSKTDFEPLRPLFVENSLRIEKICIDEAYRIHIESYQWLYISAVMQLDNVSISTNCVSWGES